MTSSMLCAALLGAVFAAPSASVASGHDHHTVTQQKSSVDHRLAGSQADLDEISARLRSAQQELDAAVSDLAGARDRLASLRVQVQQATVRDQQMQAALVVARQRLAQADVDLAQGRATVARQRSTLVSYAVSNAQYQITDLSTLGLIFGSSSTHEAIDQAQGANSALDRQLSDLQRLQANQVLLGYTEQRVRRATGQVAADRAAAAAQLATTRDLESAAAAAEANVAQQVADLQARHDNLAAAKQTELDQIATLRHERSDLEAQLRTIAAERAARRGTSSATSTSADGGFLSYPVHDTYVTSPYGMRLHPILHIWELHDGTDFHALCGSPVYAAADATVTSEYYNVGYGNRLLLDHGVVSGVSLWTSYNHLSSFVAIVGQHVTRGQLIAYSGTTGFSTGCHLHFMVYVNGYTVNPMTWL